MLVTLPVIALAVALNQPATARSSPALGPQQVAAHSPAGMHTPMLGRALQRPTVPPFISSRPHSTGTVPDSTGTVPDSTGSVPDSRTTGSGGQISIEGLSRGR